VAFYASLRGGGGDIELVSIEKQRLVAVKWLQDLFPSVENKAVQSLSWSSTGKEIAFVVVDFSSRRTRPFWGQVFVVNRDFADLRTLTPENMFCDDVQWSPDASQLTFVCDDGDPYASVWVVNADGSNLHTITKSAKDVSGPQWQPTTP
jgi:Tol biopolymer transport system component